MKNNKFTKLHGLGNDFILLDCRNEPFDWTVNEIKLYSDRFFGIGFDQLLIIENTDKADFKYRIFNADGQEVEHCGNGARCFGKYLLDKKIFSFNRPVRVEVKKGFIEIDYVGKMNHSDYFKVDMGQPNFQFFTDKQTDALQQAIIIEDKRYYLSILSMGNPHAIMQVDSVDSVNVEKLGLAIQKNELFPESVNVGFMQVINNHEIKLRVFERGVGETHACGTGACAAVAAGIKRQLLNDKVKVILKGGNLEVDWQEGHSLFMSGPAEKVYDGLI